MSQDPAPYLATPGLLRAYLATLLDPATRDQVPWQGIIVWTIGGAPIPTVGVATTWALLSKS